MISIKKSLYQTKRVLFIPIKGVLAIPTGEKTTELPIDNYCFIDGSPALSGEDIDVVVVIYEEYNRNA